MNEHEKNITIKAPQGNKAKHLSRFIHPDSAPFPRQHVDLMMDALPDKVEAGINDLLDEFCRKTEAILMNRII